MEEPSVGNFEVYRTVLYPKAIAAIREHLRETQIDALEELCLRTMQLVESGHVAIPDTPEGSIFRLLVIKAINEVLGFIGCCRAGTSWSSHHQIRALLEIYAATVHIVAKPKSRAKRIARFLEYADFVRYQRHLQDVARQLTPEELSRQRFISLDDEELLGARAEHWRKLYGEQDLLRVQHWHSPSSIRTMFEELEQFDLARDVGNSTEDAQPKDWWHIYGLICHMTHVSPVGHQGVGTDGFPLLGFSRDLQRLRDGIGIAAAAFSACLFVWDKQYVPGARLLERTRRQIVKMIEHSQQAAAHGKRRVL